MDYDVTRHGSGLRILLSGQFTFNDNHKFRQIIDLCMNDAVNFVEIDFSQVDFIDSAGLGMLLLLRDSCHKRHLQVSLHAAQGQVDKVFSISKFDQLFSIHP